MKPNGFHRLATVLVALLALGLAACSPGTSEPQDRQLVVGASASPNTMESHPPPMQRRSHRCCFTTSTRPF